MARTWRVFQNCIAFLIILGFTNIVIAQALPSGWRYPTQEELSDMWRNNYPAKGAEVVGDFDGDGKPDRATLLVFNANKNLGLFIFLSGDRAGWRKVDVLRDPQAIHSMGIEMLHPGNYPTACGKGYFPCKRGEPEYIDFDTDAINYFKIESANRNIFFDKRSRSFRKVWMSD